MMVDGVEVDGSMHPLEVRVGRDLTLRCNAPTAKTIFRGKNNANTARYHLILLSIVHNTPPPSSFSVMSSSTALPPVRPAAHTAQYVKGGQAVIGKNGKILTKQQINQIAARERQAAAAEKAKRDAANGIVAPPPTNSNKKKYPDNSKKRKQPSHDSDSDSGSDDEDAPHRKATKSSANASASSSSSAAPITDKSGRVDTTGMDAKEAKAAIVAAKRAARALKKEKNRAQAEAAGTHPTQRELQLMNRDLQAVKLWELYIQDRRERGEELTPLEMDEHLQGKNLAQIPNHESMDSHSFKLLHKHLKSMYGGNYAEQVLGGTIQPALSTKQERFDKKKEKQAKVAAGKSDEVEEEEEQEIQQKQELMDDPKIGAPYVVFISPSAVRAVECGRGFKQIPMNTRVVKLFAKHLKVSFHSLQSSMIGPFRPCSRFYLATERLVVPHIGLLGFLTFFCFLLVPFVFPSFRLLSD